MISIHERKFTFLLHETHIYNGRSFTKHIRTIRNFQFIKIWYTRVSDLGKYFHRYFVQFCNFHLLLFFWYFFPPSLSLSLSKQAYKLGVEIRASWNVFCSRAVIDKITGQTRFDLVAYITWTFANCCKYLPGKLTEQNSSFVSSSHVTIWVNFYPLERNVLMNRTSLNFCLEKNEKIILKFQIWEKRIEIYIKKSLFFRLV